MTRNERITHSGDSITGRTPTPDGVCRANRHRRRTNGRTTVMVGVRFTSEMLDKIDAIVSTSEFPTSRAGVIEALVVRAIQATDGIRAAV